MEHLCIYYQVVSMKKLILYTLILGIIFFAGCASNQTAETTSTTLTQEATTTTLVAGTQVLIKNFAFSPAELKIKVGETVLWVNQDAAPHKLESDSGTEINSETLSNAQTYSHTFQTAGTYAYHCSIHPSMKASVTVE
jgi:amicyanin